MQKNLSFLNDQTPTTNEDVPYNRSYAVIPASPISFILKSYDDLCGNAHHPIIADLVS